MTPSVWSISCVVVSLLATQTSSQFVSRDPCASYSCENGGTCTAPEDKPYCLCTPGFVGANCEIQKARTTRRPIPISRDPCQFYVCENGGTCTAPADAPYCLCPPFYTGKTCETRIVSRDPCQFYVCENGGTCTAPADAPYCLCPPFYTGKTCETRIVSRDPCQFYVCRNGGTCTAPADAPYCLCPPNYTGKSCEMRIGTNDPCIDFKCDNGGQCYAPDGAPVCRCPPGFGGERCEVSREKPGTCPDVKPDSFGVCGGRPCQADGDCPTAEKCCDSACGGKLCTSVEPLPPPFPQLTCATVLCVTGSVCRMVLPCETCDLKPRCIPQDVLGPSPDIECERQNYLEVLLVESTVTGSPSYSQLKCRGPLATRDCPIGYVCADDLRGGGTCCTGKPDPTVIKPGRCPQGELSVCGGIFCSYDSECPGAQKCCPGCGMLCTDPVPEEELCGNSVCGPDEVCVQKQPVCPPGRFCIQALIPTCVSKECANCAYDEDCKEIEVPVVEPARKKTPHPACNGRFFNSILCNIEYDDAGSADAKTVASKSYQCVPRTSSSPCGPEPCQPGEECRVVTYECPDPEEDDADDIAGPCREVYECQAVDECGGCPKGQICKDTGIRCFTTPCPTFQCVPDDPCGGCLKGEVCKDTGIVCKKEPCPTFQCVPDDPCGGCAPDEVCVDSGIRCFTTPCDTYKCVARDECGGCPAGQRCDMLYPPCPAPPDCDLLRETDPNADCIIPRCDPIPTCVADDPCGGCPDGQICKDSGIRCVMAPCPTFQCVADDPCGGCPAGEVCIDTGVRCITTPCDTYKCVPQDRCGGCPRGQRCDLLYPPCPPPPDCDTLRELDPNAECIIPRCDPIPTCVDDTPPPLREITKPPTATRPEPAGAPKPDNTETGTGVCPLRCKAGYTCQAKEPYCPGSFCLLRLEFECVPEQRKARFCPNVPRTYTSTSLMCMLEDLFLSKCESDADCADPNDMCCGSNCGRRVCTNPDKGVLPYFW